MRKLAFNVIVASALAIAPIQAQAQAFDPRPTLMQLISAFQNCGPPQVYQMLGQQLFQLVSMQTGNTGCYAQIRAAGPVTGMQVLQQQEFPVGPVFLVRVTHQVGGQVDWFIGISRFTNRVEYLAHQPAQGGTSIVNGPAPDAQGPIPTQPNPAPAPNPNPNPGGAQPEGCDVYPTMCQ